MPVPVPPENWLDARVGENGLTVAGLLADLRSVAEYYRDGRWREQSDPGGVARGAVHRIERAVVAGQESRARATLRADALRDAVHLAHDHPKRAAVVAVMRRHEHPMSPVMLKDVLGEPLGTVAYHVRVLVARGDLVPHAERRVRGAVEHLYRLKP